MGFIKKEVKHAVAVLQKWTELDVMYYVRGGAWVFSSQIMLVLFSLLLSIGFAYLTSKETYGQFQFILAVLGVLSTFVLPGANTAVFLGVAQKKEGTLIQGTRLKLKYSVLGVLGLLCTAGYFYLRKEPSYEFMWLIFLIAVIFFPVLYSFDLWGSFFAGRRKFARVSIIQLSLEGISVLVALLALFLTKNLLVVVVLYLFVKAIGEFFAFRYAVSKIANKKIDPDFALYSKHLTVINFIPSIRSYLDKIVVTFFLGFAATAVYSIGAAIAEQLYAVAKNISIITFPKIAVLKQNVYAEVKRRTGKLVLFFVLIAIIAVLVAPYLIPFVFSEQYRVSVPIAQLLLLVTIPRAVAYFLTKVQEAKRQSRKLYIINISYALVEIVALLVLAPFYGLYGIIGAKAISNSVYLGLAWLSLR